MGGKSGQTIGFHYLFDILFGLSRGPINELVEIVIGEKSAWQGSATDNSMQAITKPDLFGGEKKEGGIQGPFRLFMGRFDQILPGAGTANCGSSGPNSGLQTLPDVKAAIGGRVSEFRGTSRLWYSGLISSMNPYPKEWKFRLRRYNAGWYNDEPWYPIMARVLLQDESGNAIHAMNPAHIIYECLTNPSWGRGLPAAYIDENAFIYAANTLCSEGFGLCFNWQRKDDIDVFINTVLEHISASLYLDPETGRMVLKLWRNDYVADDLPLFTLTNGLLEITEDDSSSQDASFNEVIGKGHDPVTNQDFQLRVHNLAARESQGAANPDTKEYPGIPTRSLLVRAIQRDLKMDASGLKKFAVALDRRGWRIRPGMCFRISHPKHDIGNFVLRAVEVTDNGSRKGRIEIKAMQDVFGMPSTSFVTPVVPSWTPPPSEALPAAAERLLEANYRDIRLRLASSDMADFDGDSVIGVLALAPDPTMYQFDLATKAQGETDLVVRSTGSFTGSAILVADIGPYDTDFEISDEFAFPSDLVGQTILCGDEQMAVTAYDSGTHMLTVDRGVTDTIPAAHAAGERLWTIDDDFVSDGRAYVPGETVEASVLTRALGDVLTLAEADVLSLVTDGRWNRPFPPGNVRVDGDLAMALTDEHTEPVVTWSDRDRVLQDDQLVGHLEASVGPEAGTTYNLRVYDNAAPAVVLRDVPGATTGWQYDAATQALDGGPTSIWIELESERDGLVSEQHYRFLVILSAASFDSTGTTFDDTSHTLDEA